MKLLPLSQGKSAIVDDDLFEFLNQWKWCLAKDRTENLFYAKRGFWFSGKQIKISMHQVILGASLDGLDIDHINGNGLDNRRENLRHLTRRENMLNTRRRRNGQTKSRYPGVYSRGISGSWFSKIYINGKHKRLGSFADEESAHRAYLAAKSVLFPEGKP